MGLFLKAVGIGLTIKAIKKLSDADVKRQKEEENRREEEKKRRKEEEIRRKSIHCYFDGEISKEEFNAMVKRGGKKIRRITSLYANGPIVHGTVQSQSGISDWSFRIDFNDYGELTGKYWLSSDNDDSDIPKIVADRIAQQIRDHSGRVDSSFEDELKHEEPQEEAPKPDGACCPYCGKQNYNEGAKFCMYCGMRFHV